MVGEKKPGFGEKLKGTFARYRRVLSVARKPDIAEYVSSMKITGAALGFLGLIGFIIFLLYYLLRLVVV